MSKPIIILGAGGHAKVLLEALIQSGQEILGLTDPEKVKASKFWGTKILGNDDAVLNYPPDEVTLVNGVGAMPGNNLRAKLTCKMLESGYTFSKVIHPSAIIANDVVLSSDVQIMAGVVIQPGVQIGESCIINTKVAIDHDCIINDNCHLAPGVTLSGAVVIGKGTHLGTGASVINNINIGESCIVGAGSIVFKDIESNSKYIQKRKEYLLEN